MKRYLWLMGATLVAAVLLAGLVRSPRPRVVAPEAAPIPEVALRLSIEQRSLTPERSAVPKEHRVRLEVVNRGAAAVTLELAGYQDLLPPRSIAPGEIWKGTFVATRPGDDFAWLLDGHPVGQLRVAGSHLVEGHR